MYDQTKTIIALLQSIGLTVRLTPLGQPTFLPGVTLDSNGLLIDPAKLFYPGDLLHEAGHLAVMLPAHRASSQP